MAAAMTRNNANRYRFPQRHHNRFQLLVDGDHFFPVMLNAIATAQHSVILEMYLLESGTLLTRFIDTLITSASRGVSIFLLFDDFGALGINKADRQRLAEHTNIHLKFYGPIHYRSWQHLLSRNHRKLLLVDNRIAFIGGTGISDAFTGEQGWHELMVQVEGECVQDWRALFIDNWPGTADEIKLLTATPCRYPATAEQSGRTTLSQLLSHQEIQSALLRRLAAAKHEAWITTAYFIPSWRLRRALKAAAQRGVDVRLILPGHHTDHPAIRHAGHRFYHHLLYHGVRIFEYQPRFTHAKAYLCDQWCSIGSSNLDRWNLRWNLEGNQEIDAPEFALALKTALEHDLLECQEISLTSWQARPWPRRLLEWFWGRIDAGLTYLSNRH